MWLKLKKWWIEIKLKALHKALMYKLKNQK